MLKKIFILNLLISFTLSWNSNTCAWGSIGKQQPKGKEDCLGDQTNPVSDCCYMKLEIMGETIFNVCYSLPKYIVNSGTDEELKKGLQADIGNLFKITELNCKSDNPIEPHPDNVYSPNTCAYDNLKYDAPKKIEDCVLDKDPSNSSKCCYTETTWNGLSQKSCSSFSKIRDLDFETWKGVYKQMGGDISVMECRVKEKAPVPKLNLKSNGKEHIKILSFSILILLIFIIL